MKRYLLIFLIICLTGLCTFGQSLTKIKSKILKADSIVLTSHAYPGFAVCDKEEPDDRKLVLNGKINPKLIKEQKRLTDLSVKYLATFITKPFSDKKIVEDQCFTPHHTIYIFKGKKVSYIDICFLCEEIACSDDIIFPFNDFDHATWKKMEKFFLSQGFTYGFDENDPG